LVARHGKSNEAARHLKKNDTRVFIRDT